MAPFGPDPTMVSNELPAAPSRRIVGVELEGELLLGGLLGQAVAHLGQRVVGDDRRGLDAGHLAGVLDQAQRVDEARRWRTSSASGNHSAA